MCGQTLKNTENNSKCHKFMQKDIKKIRLKKGDLYMKIESVSAANEVM